METPEPVRPPRHSNRTPARELARLAVDAMQSKKGLDITVIDVRKVSEVTDYYVLATGESDLQVRAIVEAVQETIREEVGERAWKKEGTERHQWVVLDYVDMVVHVFDTERRAYYDFERLWGDAPTEHVSADAEVVELLATTDEPGSAE